MKKGIRIGFAALVLALLLLPAAGLVCFGGDRAAGNEVSAPPPSLRKADGSLNGAFPAELTDYTADRFWLRNRCITLWGRLQAALGASANEDVLLGTDGWLYFRDTLDDFEGRGLTDEELTRIADRLLEIQTETERRGGTFLFVPVPNKNTAVPEHMPRRCVSDRSGANLTRLLPLLDERGVRYADLSESLRGEEYWYRTDTHWNGRGAALAAEEILAALGRSSGREPARLVENGGQTGDLYAMLLPAGRQTEPVLQPEGGFAHVTEDEVNGGMALRIRTSCADGAGTLFCRRDSFGSALYPWLADAFGEAEFTRDTDYDSVGEADVYVLETAERNLPKLLGQA